jgi:hypothetical protein
VVFTLGDVRDFGDAEPFDAVVGRLILLYTPDPVAVIRHHAGSLRSGGVFLAMEYEMPAARTVPTCPATITAARRVIDAFERSGLDPVLGARLGNLLRDAGFDHVDTIGIQPYLSPRQGAAMLTGIVRTLLPVIERTGIATPTEVDVATLTARLTTEMQRRHAVMAPPTLVGAWSRSINANR